MADDIASHKVSSRPDEKNVFWFYCRFSTYTRSVSHQVLTRQSIFICLLIPELAVCACERMSLTDKPALPCLALSVSLAETNRRGLHTNRRPPDKSASGLRPLDVRILKYKDLSEAQGRFEDGGRYVVNVGGWLCMYSESLSVWSV